MAALHSALRSLGPISFSAIPTESSEVDDYLSELFTDCQLILESVPISDPSDASARSRAQTTSSVASNASEMSASSARSAAPAPETAALQKEWGKAVKLSAKENPLSMSVYKLSGKDGKGAWFARRSVHEGLGYSRFRSSLQREFPESLEGGSGPGEGNIRGIGGERKVEDIEVKGKGRIQTWQLSAQFPGPTTPRDFVTLLVTSSHAMKEHHPSNIPRIEPRHYMIISKPCDHPETQPRSGYIRGNYESVEFIREVPRKQKTVTSSADPHRDQGSPSLEKDTQLKNAEKKGSSLPPHEDGKSSENLEGVPQSPVHGSSGSQEDDYDAEENPVEWIMITRSDPGGSVPRFMVERGTPSSIVADASKFLDWACKKHDEPIEGEATSQDRPRPTHRDSFASWQANGQLTRIDDSAGAEEASKGTDAEAFPDLVEQSGEQMSIEEPEDAGTSTSPQQSGGMFGSVKGALGTYAPQSVLDHLPAGISTSKEQSSSSAILETPVSSNERPDQRIPDHDAVSTVSSLSFASADSHIGESDEDPSISSKSTPEKDAENKPKAKPTETEKEVAKTQKRRATLETKLAAAKEKYTKDADSQGDKVRKAEEKYKKELEKEEERHRKQITKMEEQKQKETKKAEEKAKKERDKDENGRLTRERDEAKSEAGLLTKQVELMTKQIGELQKENTMLMARIGKMENDAGTASPARRLVSEETKGRRSRSSSLRRLMGSEKALEV